MPRPALTEAVDFFDRLIRSDLSIQSVCDRVARYTGREVGCTDRQGHSTVANPDSDGSPRGGIRVPDGATRKQLISGEEVWVGPVAVSDIPVDDLLELFSVLARSTMARSRRWSVAAAGVRTAIGGGALDERRDALRSLGLGLRETVRILGVAGPESGRIRIIDELRDRAKGAVYSAPMGHVSAVIVGGGASVDRLNVPGGNHLGVSLPVSAEDAPQGWEQAFAALRFSQPATRTARDHTVEEAAQMHYEIMFNYAPLAEAWSTERMAALPDVQALDTLLSQEDSNMLRTLDVIGATDTFREAARQLHTHHSTVASRVARAERVLGFSISGNYGRVRLVLALMMRRLRASASLL